MSEQRERHRGTWHVALGRGLCLTALLAPAGLAGQGKAPVWRLSASPVYTLGGEDHPELEFLRVSTVQLSPDGTLLVANGDPLELRRFDSQGRLIRRIGRAGEGPGEFRQIAWAARQGDSLFTFDMRNRRVTIMDLEGKVSGTPSPPIVADALSLGIVGRLSCGTWAAYGLRIVDRRAQTGVGRDSMRVLLLKPQLDGVQGELGPLPGMTSVVLASGSGASRRVGVTPMAFGPTLLPGVSDNLVYTMDTATPELRLWDCAGRSSGRLIVPIPAGRSVTPAMIEEAKARDLARLPANAPAGSRELIEMRYQSASLPSTLPTVSRVVTGSRGEFWFEVYEPDPKTPSSWWILAANGATRGRLVSPAGFRIRAVQGDLVAGVHTDDDGIETVRVYRIERTP